MTLIPLERNAVSEQLPTKVEPGISGGGATATQDRSFSIKKVTLEQVVDFLNYAKTFWVWILGLIALVYGALSYFATSAALQQLACESERRATESKQRAAVLVLNSERVASRNHENTLLRLQVVLLELQAKNPKSPLDLSALKVQIEKLIDTSKQEQVQKEGAFKEAEQNLAVAERAIAGCGGVE